MIFQFISAHVAVQYLRLFNACMDEIILVSMQNWKKRYRKDTFKSIIILLRLAEVATC